LRLYLAFILIGTAPDPTLISGASLIIYATYTLDRSLKSHEDHVNSLTFSDIDRTYGLLATIIAVAAGTYLFFSHALFWIPIFPFITGFIYSRGVSLGTKKIKLKTGMGGKNLIIGITWGGTIGLIISTTGNLSAAILISLFYGMKLFINSTIYDCKDIEGDLAAGIRTLPAVWGIRRMKEVLFTILLIQHLILIAGMITGIISFFSFFVIYSLISGGGVIIWYSPLFETNKAGLKRWFRVLAIDGESPVQVIVSMIHPG
jgi:4-hydroxybenzoate polyprenyltransferase